MPSDVYNIWNSRQHKTAVVVAVVSWLLGPPWTIPLPGECGFMVDLNVPGRRGKGTVVPTMKLGGEGTMPQRMMRGNQGVSGSKNNRFPPFLICKSFAIELQCYC